MHETHDRDNVVALSVPQRLDTRIAYLLQSLAVAGVLLGGYLSVGR